MLRAKRSRAVYVSEARYKVQNVVAFMSVVLCVLCVVLLTVN